MRTVHLSDDDAAQIKAILLTHAEMTDQHAMPSMELRSRIARDEDQEDGEVKEMIATLDEQITDFETDSDNLKRLSNFF